jgi:lipoate---protein ligase
MRGYPVGAAPRATLLPAMVVAERSVVHVEPEALLAADEALLLANQPRLRWSIATAPALVLGFAQRRRAAELIDPARMATHGVRTLERRAGGGLVFLDAGMLCLTVVLPAPHPLLGDDVTESYRWLGDALAAGLRRLGVGDAARIETGAARAAAAALRARSDPIGYLLRETCYAAPSPHEVLVGDAKLVGFAQVRRRDRALFQVGLLLRDQSGLADLVRLEDERDRARYRSELRQRTIGLDRLLPSAPDPEAIARALAEDLSPLLAQGPGR